VGYHRLRTESRAQQGGGGTHHDTSVIRRPSDEGNLVAGTLARLELVLKVIDGVAGTLAFLAL